MKTFLLSTLLFALVLIPGSAFSKGVTMVPIKFHTFSATLSNDTKVGLDWSTASQVNVSHFAIERSTDGKNYKDVGIVLAYTSGQDQTEYDFTDNFNVPKGVVVYYRIRAVDNDQNYKHSVTRLIRVGTTEANEIGLIAYPNPVTTELHVTLPSNWQNKKVTYELFHLGGQQAVRIESTNSSQTETLNVKNLPLGLYMVRVSCNGETVQKKIIKN
jgi:hypothetical protein